MVKLYHRNVLICCVMILLAGYKEVDDNDDFPQKKTMINVSYEVYLDEN